MHILEQEAVRNRDLIDMGRRDIAAKASAIDQLHDLLNESQVKVAWTCVIFAPVVRVQPLCG